MRAITRELLPRTTYRFTAAELPAGQALLVPVELGVGTEAYREATLIARVHGAPAWTSGASVAFELYVAAPTEEDPGRRFRASAPRLTLAISSADVGSASSYTGEASVASGLGGVADVLVRLAQPAGAGSYAVTVSAELVLRAGAG